MLSNGVPYFLDYMCSYPKKLLHNELIGFLVDLSWQRPRIEANSEKNCQFFGGHVYSFRIILC